MASRSRLICVSQRWLSVICATNMRKVSGRGDEHAMRQLQPEDLGWEGGKRGHHALGASPAGQLQHQNGERRAAFDIPSLQDQQGDGKANQRRNDERQGKSVKRERHGESLYSIPRENTMTGMGDLEFRWGSKGTVSSE